MHKVNKYFLAVLFLMVVFAVPLLGLCNRKTMDETENRMLNAFPLDAAGPREFLEGVSLYLDDHFGLRDQFIQLHGRINQRFSAQTLRSKGVVEGTDGWLFHMKSVSIYEGKMPQEPIDAFVSRIAALQNEVAPIPVVIAAVPNKAFVYEDALPDYVIKGSQRSETVEALKKISGIHTVDLYEVLKNEPAKTYTLHDTHWNGWGAFVAYREIIRFINEATGMTVPMNTDIETIEEIPDYKGDLSKVIDQYGKLLDTNNRVILRNTSAREIDKVCDKEQYSVPDYANPNGRGKVFLMHDSFGQHCLSGYLAESFSELNTLWAFTLWDMKFDTAVDAITQSQPDLVLIEIVDRFIKLDE